MLTRFEQMAMEYLCDVKGYAKESIVKNYRTPDFICPDGKRYEVKQLLGNSIRFHPHQIAQMLDEDFVLIFDDSGFVSYFQWKDRGDSFIKIGIDGGCLESIRISESTYQELLSRRLVLSETFDSVIQRHLRKVKL